MSLTIGLERPTSEELISINQELSRSKLPPYNYDESLVPKDIEFPGFNWGFTDKYYYNNLKIISAKLWQDPNWITDRDFVHPQYRKDSEIELEKYLLEEVRTQDKSHLACPSFYGTDFTLTISNYLIWCRSIAAIRILSIDLTLIIIAPSDIVKEMG